ncbi:hypothetical protein ACE6H2_028467 [Prunus campanulata]
MFLRYRSVPVVFAAQSNFLKVVQTVWKVGKDGIEAGTNLVTDSVPRSIARVSVTVVALALSLFVLKSLLSTVVASELRMLIRYVLQMRLMKSGRILVDMMERLILMEDSENISLAPFVAMDMSKIGHASIQVSRHVGRS